ncbi:MAG: hypothetical protein ACE5Z5_09020 [Candidatus Bathyarchaeia archaeon]
MEVVGGPQPRYEGPLSEGVYKSVGRCRGKPPSPLETASKTPSKFIKPLFKIIDRALPAD